MKRTSLMLAVLIIGLIAGAGWGQSILSIPFASKSPIIDGIIKPGEWDNAAVTSGFKILRDGTPVTGATIIHATYNNYALFLAWECKGENMEKLKGKLDERDSAIWVESSIELFLANSNWPLNKYAHFMVNHAGTIADEMCVGKVFDMDWDPDWQVKIGKTQDSYVAEMAIPWASVNITPRVGLEIRANMTRNALSMLNGSGENGTWSKMSGGFHNPDKFGTFVLAGNEAAVQIDEMPARTKGTVKVNAKLTDSSKTHTLSIKSMSGSRNKGKVKKTTFNKSGSASVATEVGFGANDLLVQVKNTSGSILWSQTVGMSIPNITAKLGNIKSEINKLTNLRKSMSKKYGANSEMVSVIDRTINETRSDLTRMEATSKTELSVDALTMLMIEMDKPLGRSTKINTAAAYASNTGRTDGSLPKFFLTNPVSTQKILPSTGEVGPIAQNLRIAMMKNEFEPVQLVVSPTTSSLQNVSVTASSLTGPGGASIPAERLVITPIASVNCKVQTPGATYSGLVPDVLMPYKPMNIDRDNRQPYFITVHTTAADLAGEYNGTIRVAVDGRDSVELPLRVQLYDITLPVKSSLRTVFLLDWAFHNFLDGTDLMDARINYSKTMLEHRLSASSTINPSKRADGTWDFEALDKYIDALVPLGQTTLKVPYGGEALKVAAEHFKARGVWDLHYLYGEDEAATSRTPELQTTYKKFIDTVPDVKVMQTGWNPTDKLKDLVKIWCPLTSSADMKLVRESQAAGEEVWWYVCCGPIAPYANLFVDYPGIDHRMLGWQTFQYGITGFLYWGLDVWHYAGNNLPLDEYIEADYANWNPQSFENYNGDGYLCYPGKKGTAVPSMRLALLRDGFEDCDMLNEAKALASKAGHAGNKLEKLIKIGAPISKDLKTFTQDGNVLLQKREEILKEMEKVQKAIR